MKATVSILFTTSLTVGVVFGWQMRVRTGAEASGRMENLVRNKENQGRSRGSGASAGEMVSGRARSGDSAEMIHALANEELYDRMALFLLNTKASDFPAFYEEFQQRDDRTNDLNDLLFISWTRLDPEAAIAATQGTDDFRYVYWAWACHDPGSALAAAQARDEGLHNALWGIGEFHPQWLTENLDLIPKDWLGSCMSGVQKWPDTENPEATLRLLFESGYGKHYGQNSQTLVALARQDPANAYEVIKELSKAEPYGPKVLLEDLIKSVARSEPSLLSKMAEHSKNPVDQRMLKLAQFNNVIAEDLEAAKAILESTPKSWLRDDLGVSYAQHLFKEDPERGFEVAIELFKDNFGGFSRDTSIRTESGNSSFSFVSSESSGEHELINDLVGHGGAGVLDALKPESGSRNAAFNVASDQYVKQDLNGYASWLEGQQENTKIYEFGVHRLTQSLKKMGEYAAGMEWLQSTPGGSRYREINYYNDWLRTDPEAAVAWRNSDQFNGNLEDFPIPDHSDSE